MTDLAIIKSSTLTNIADAIREKRGITSTGSTSEYTQLEYIESDGKQYIDTEYYQTTEKMKIVMRFLLTEIKAWCAICGVEGTTDKRLALTPMLDASSQLTIYAGKGNTNCGIPVAVNTVYDLSCEYDNNAITCHLRNEETDNTANATATSTDTLCTTDTIYAFTLNSATDANIMSQASKMRMYSFQIYDNDVLVRDFVAAKKNSDGSVGLYDNVNNEFYLSPNGASFVGSTTEIGSIEVGDGTADYRLIPATSMADEILSIETGSDVSGVTATANDVISDKYFVDSDGELVRGNIPRNTLAAPTLNIDSSTGVVTANVNQTTSGYIAASEKSNTLTLTTQGAKTITPSTSEQTAVEAGVYTTGKITVAAVSATEQDTPTISVSSSGLITATAGTKSATKQLTTKAATTITPSALSQTAVSSGVYTTGKITVAAVPTQTKSATPSASTQTVTPDAGKFLSSVTVNPVETVEGTASPSATTMVYKPSTGKFYSQFTVNAVESSPSAIVEYVSSSNVSKSGGQLIVSTSQSVTKVLALCLVFTSFSSAYMSETTLMSYNGENVEYIESDFNVGETTSYSVLIDTPSGDSEIIIKDDPAESGVPLNVGFIKDTYLTAGFVVYESESIFT